MIRPLEPHHALGCDAVLRSLPYHFGDPDGQRECHDAVRTSEGFVDVDGDDVCGFVTFRLHSRESAEVTWLAVREDLRRAGIGGRLVDRAATELRERGVRFLSLLTLADSVTESRTTDTYADTRRFYERHGFAPVRELDLRDWSFPALLLVKVL